jgi:hypothetical protein
MPPCQRLVLVVLDAHGMWPILAAIVRPGQKSSHHVLGPLQPLEANDGDCRGLGPGFLDAAPGEPIDLLTSDCVLLTFRAALESEVVPRVRVLLVKQLRVQSAHDTPDFAAESDHLLALPQPENAEANS